MKIFCAVWCGYCGRYIKVNSQDDLLTHLDECEADSCAFVFEEDDDDDDI